MTRTLVGTSNFSFLMPWRGLLQRILVFSGSAIQGCEFELWLGPVSTSSNIPVVSGNNVAQGPVAVVTTPPPSTDAALNVIPAAPVIVEVNIPLTVGQMLSGTISSGANADRVVLFFEVK